MNPEDYLKSLVDYEKQPTYDYDLNEFVRFLEHLVSPQHKLRNIIHIGGTKGKGACSALLASCPEHCGYPVGQYTSPHLATLNERIKINDRPIKNSELSLYIDKIKRIKRKKGIQAVHALFLKLLQLLPSCILSGRTPTLRSLKSV